MMDLEFTFEQAPWEESLMALQPGDTISAMQLLTLLEGESEDTVQNVLLELEARHVALDITDLPRGFGGGEAALRLRREAELVKNGTLLQSLEENDPLRLYLEEVAALPAAGDTQKMAERFAGGYDPVLPGLTNLAAQGDRNGPADDRLQCTAAGSDPGGKFGSVAGYPQFPER